MNRKYRRFPFFDDFTDFGFSAEFQRMFDEMNAMMEHVKSNPDLESGKPVYYGYSVEVGPDGIPHVKEWGNVKPGLPPGKDARDSITAENCGCEPEAGQEMVAAEASYGDIDSCYASTMYDDKTDVLKIHADIPGITKEDIDLEFKDNKLILDARNESRHYHKIIPLDRNVNPKSIKAEYNNGVLEISLKCKKPKKSDKGKKIKVD